MILQWSNILLNPFERSCQLKLGWVIDNSKCGSATDVWRSEKFNPVLANGPARRKNSCLSWRRLLFCLQLSAMILCLLLYQYRYEGPTEQPRLCRDLVHSGTMNHQWWDHQCQLVRHSLTQDCELSDLSRGNLANPWGVMGPYLELISTHYLLALLEHR